LFLHQHSDFLIKKKKKRGGERKKDESKRGGGGGEWSLDLFTLVRENLGKKKEGEGSAIFSLKPSRRNLEREDRRCRSAQTPLLAAAAKKGKRGGGRPAVSRFCPGEVLGKRSQAVLAAVKWGEKSGASFFGGEAVRGGGRGGNWIAFSLPSAGGERPSPTPPDVERGKGIRKEDRDPLFYSF